MGRVESGLTPRWVVEALAGCAADVTQAAHQNAAAAVKRIRKNWLHHLLLREDNHCEANVRVQPRSGRVAGNCRNFSCRL
jgi:hypothetical protein